jgi:hypothetical protein
MARTRAERIAEIKSKREQLANKAKELLQAQRAKDRKDRTKRLCKRMGLFESMLPETIPLTDDLFKSFLEKTVATEQSRRILDGLTEQNAATATPERTGMAAQGNTTPAPHPASTGQASGADEGEDEGNGARVNG